MHANKPQPGLSEKAPGPGLSEHGLRTVLLLAFGGLLALMLVASVSALLSLRQLHAVEQQVASRFLSRTQALSEVVISVHIYDDQLAEFLLDDRAVELRESGPEIAERAAKVHSALRRYPSDGGPRERQLLEEIEESLSQQESISSAMLSLTPGDRKTRSPKFIQEPLLPRSLSILQVSQQIASLNGQELAKSNQDLLARFASLQSKLKSMLLAALTAGLVLSLLENFLGPASRAPGTGALSRTSGQPPRARKIVRAALGYPRAGAPVDRPRASRRSGAVIGSTPGGSGALVQTCARERRSHARADCQPKDPRREFR